MKNTTKTDPFSGHEISCIEFDNGSLLAGHALTGHAIYLVYDAELDVYIVEKSALKHMPVASLQEAADLMEVTKSRVSAMCLRGQLDYSKVSPGMVVSLESINNYMNNDARRGYATIASNDNGE